MICIWLKEPTPCLYNTEKENECGVLLLLQELTEEDRERIIKKCPGLEGRAGK